MNLERCKEALLFRNQNLSDTPINLTLQRVNQYMSSGIGKVQVEASAIQFYLLNQAFGLLMMQVEPKADLSPPQEDLAKLYLTTASESSARLFYYILLIITREARHVYENTTLEASLMKKYGSEFTGFLKTIKGSNSSSAVDKFLKYKFKDLTLGNYVSGITQVFEKGKFSSGYGGKPWANIADTLRKMVYGETSIEIMNDTAWTLAHNNGPMFNKGMLYETYTPYIYKILDVQRGGMIPQLLSEGIATKYTTSQVLAAMATVKKAFPDLIKGYVDWYKVEELGSIHKYSDEKKVQDAKFGKPKKGTTATTDKKPILSGQFTTKPVVLSKATVDLEDSGDEFDTDDPKTSKYWVSESEYARVIERTS